VYRHICVCLVIMAIIRVIVADLQLRWGTKRLGSTSIELHTVHYVLILSLSPPSLEMQRRVELLSNQQQYTCTHSLPRHE